MGTFAHPRRIIAILGVFLIAGCNTQKPSPIAKHEPSATAIAQPPPAPIPPKPAVEAPRQATPAPAALPVLTAGPWTECSASDATIAAVVTVRSNNLFHDRVGVHYLHPARSTSLRLVQLRSTAPEIIEQKEIPQACSSAFHLTNDEVYWTGTRYSIHSTLKQTPVDPTHAITLELRTRWQQSSDEKIINQSQLLNGLNHADLLNGDIFASIDIVSPQAVSDHIPPPQKPSEVGTAALRTQLESLYPDIEPLITETAFSSLLPAKFRSNSSRSGHNLHLYPDHTYVSTSWVDAADETINEEGRWTFICGLLCLERDPDKAAAQNLPLERQYYLPFNLPDDKTRQLQPTLMGTNQAYSNLLKQPALSSGSTLDRHLALKSVSLSMTIPEDGKSACPSKETILKAQTGSWNSVVDKFHLTFRQGSQHGDTFIFSGDASVEFADVRFYAETIEISNDLSLMKLQGPVQIDWDGHSYTATDAIIRVATSLIQLESASIQPKRE